MEGMRWFSTSSACNFMAGTSCLVTVYQASFCHMSHSWPGAIEEPFSSIPRNEVVSEVQRPVQVWGMAGLR